VVRVFPDMVPKLGLLEPDTIRSVIAAYNEAEGYCEALLAFGARLEVYLPTGARLEVDAPTRRAITVPRNKCPPVIMISEDVMDFIKRAIADLDTYSTR
jgi:hypothetical protein